MSELVTQEMVDAAFHAVYADGAKNIKWTALRKGIEAALNTRKPEPGQPAAVEKAFCKYCNYADGIHSWNCPYKAEDKSSRSIDDIVGDIRTSIGVNTMTGKVIVQ